MPLRLVGLALVLALLLAACAQPDAGDPSEAVEQYLTAKVAADENAMRGLLCSSMESDLSIEASSFAGLGARIENMTCARSGDSIVTCTGEIIATYGTEESAFPLASYAVVQEDGEWKWCGESG